MEIIHIEDLEFIEDFNGNFKEEYQNNIVITKDKVAFYITDSSPSPISQQLLEEIISLQNLVPDKEEYTTIEANESLSIRDITRLSEIFSVDDLCNLRANGLI